MVVAAAGRGASEEAEADTLSLLPCSLDGGLLRQGSKRLWRRLAKDSSVTGVYSDGEAEFDDETDANSAAYSILNNKLPRSSFFFIFLLHFLIIIEIFKITKFHCFRFQFNYSFVFFK